MSVLRNLESKLAGLVEGTFSRAFKSEVRPVEIARKLAREMDQHRVQSLSRTYAPNEYAVWLSPDDRAQFEGYEDELKRELAGYLLEHARRERVSLVTRPVIEFRTDDRLRRGDARLVVAGRTELLGSGGAVLGRSRDADIVVDDPNVSRKHAEVRPSGGSWIVRDLGSTNGVKVNGRRVDASRPQSLKPGDTIELGTARVTFELE